MKKYKLLTQNGYPEYKFIKGNTYSGDFRYNNEGFRVEEMYSEYPGDWELVEEEFVLPEEIVGWKLKDEYVKYKDAAACVGNYNPIYDVQSEYIKDSDKDFDGESIIPKLKQAGVLDLWFEPVYKEEEKFKVGEWVKLSETANGWGAGSEICNAVVKLTEIKKELCNEKVYFIHEGFKKRTNYNEISRLATPEEIETAQYPQITINDYKGEFFSEYVKFGCAEIDKDMFIRLFNVNQITYKGNKTNVESVTIGKGTFSKEQIKQIAEFYLNKNK